MSRLKLKLLPLVVFGLLSAVQQVHAASAQPIGIEAEDRAKLARIKAKGSVLSKSSASGKKSGGGGDDGDECSLEIGNIDTGGRRGGGPREVNIFIPGDIFQVNNRCR